MIDTLPEVVLHGLNILFFVLHSALIVFNLSGWMFPRARRMHLVCVMATLFSWIVMGAWKGLGYCLCTDWHFQIRRELGLPTDVNTYVQLMFQVMLGVRIDRLTSDILAAGSLLIVLVITGIVWVRDSKKHHGNTPLIRNTEQQNVEQQNA